MRQRILKLTRRVLVVLCVLSLFQIFQPEFVKADVYDNAYSFYQTHESEMKFLPGANNEGEIYYATKAKKDLNTGIKYITLGWKIRIFNKNGAVVDTLYYTLGGENMKTVDVCTVRGYEYCLYRVTLSNMRDRMSDEGLQALNYPNCSIVFDACTTTKLNGVLQGGMTDVGPSWGSVYTTYNGIVNAQEWSETTKETLKSYYNKIVDDLFYDVIVNRGNGISQVTGAGKYCFGTMVTVSAEVQDGYHFKNWTGNHGSPYKSFSFILCGSNVSLTANAQENSYHIVYDGNGGQGNISSQTYGFNQSFVLPTKGFSMEGATFSGWGISNADGKAQYIGGQSVSMKELVTKLNLQRENGATIVFHAIWDQGPVIKTEHIYASLEDARKGKITEEWLAQRAEAVDQEDGILPYGHNKNTSFFIENYQATHFTELQKEGDVIETFFAEDSAGNTTRKNVKIHIVDTHMYPAEKFTGKVRFISKKYFKDKKGNLISEIMGGLAEDSIWRLDETYRALLEQLFQ